MYTYLFDSELQDRRYQTEVVRIESRISELGLQGRSEKMTILKNLITTAQEAIRRGTTTLVAIGNDQTISKLLPLVIDSGVTLGIIPVGGPQKISEYLGIPSGGAACDVLSRRVVRKLDVGKVDKQYFLLQAVVSAPTRITCDNKYTVEPLDPSNQLVIGNFGAADPYGMPTDGRLELIVEAGESGWSLWKKKYSSASVFPFKEARVQAAEHATLLLDGQTVIKTPATVAVASKKLQVIVGRNRHFPA